MPASLDLQQFRSGARGLLVQMAGMGDLIMALPAITSLKEYLPGVRWTLLTRPSNVELMQEWVDHVVGIPWPPHWTNLPAVLNGIISLRRQKFDFAIHLKGVASVRGSLAMKALFRGINPKVVIGRSSQHAKDLYTVNWDESSIPSRHEVDRNLSMIESLGVPRIGDVPAFSAKAGNVHRVSELLKDFRGAARFVAMFPGGVRATRHWPIENYISIAKRLCAMGIGVCIIGGDPERDDARKIAEASHGYTLDLSGQLSIQDLAALLSLSSVYVGNDSGPTHLAAALGTPCVAVFGPGDVGRISPRGRGKIRVLRHEVWCAPCYLDTCSHHTCMRSLAVEEVYNAVMEYLPATS